MTHRNNPHYKATEARIQEMMEEGKVLAPMDWAAAAFLAAQGIAYNPENNLNNQEREALEKIIAYCPTEVLMYTAVEVGKMNAEENL